MASIVVGTNSWVTQTEANTYLEEKIGADSWATQTSNKKNQCLISAYRWINSISQYTIAASSTADNVKYAQIEAAWYMLNYWTDHEKRQALQIQGVGDFKLMEWEETFKKDAGLPSIVSDLLDDYLDDDLYGSFPQFNRDFENNRAG